MRKNWYNFYASFASIFFIFAQRNNVTVYPKDLRIYEVLIFLEFLAIFMTTNQSPRVELHNFLAKNIPMNRHWTIERPDFLSPVFYLYQ